MADSLLVGRWSISTPVLARLCTPAAVASRMRRACSPAQPMTMPAYWIPLSEPRFRLCLQLPLRWALRLCGRFTKLSIVLGLRLHVGFGELM